MEHDWVPKDARELTSRLIPCERLVATLTAENAAMTRDKENLIQQAEQWAQEARTQRSIVLEIGGLVGCDKDFEMVSAVRDYIIAMEQRLKAQLAAAEAAGREHKWSGATYDNCVNCGQSAEYADIICPSPDAPPQHAAPIDMVLFCPRCHAQHIDAPETHREMVEGVHVGNVTLWDNPPHRSHLCAECGCVWRPADVATNGVAAVKTAGRVDTPVIEQHAAVVQLASDRTGRIYLAGPMTGIENYNFPAFNTAAKELRKSWREVINPADHGVVAGAVWSDYLRYDIAKMSGCEAIALMPGWSKSSGAKLELLIAERLGLTVIFLEGAEPAEQHTARVPEWQPIETAPKDGARIWVINPVMDNPVIAAWGDYTTLSGIKTKAFVVTHDPHERFMPTTGNMVCPNRWLPLPATPAPKSEEG